MKKSPFRPVKPLHMSTGKKGHVPRPRLRTRHLSTIGKSAFAGPAPDLGGPTSAFPGAGAPPGGPPGAPAFAPVGGPGGPPDAGALEGGGGGPPGM